MKQFFGLFAAILVLLSGCHNISEEGVTINGEVAGLEAGEVQIKGKNGRLADAALSGNNDMVEYNGFLAGFKTGISTAVNESALGIKTGNPLGDYIGRWIAAHPSSAVGTALLEQYRLGPLPDDTVIAESAPVVRNR